MRAWRAGSGSGSPSAATPSCSSAAEPDAVLVCSPNETHAEVVLDALAAGAHVLVEKPLCLTERDAARIVTARDRAGLVVQVGYMKRFDPAYEALLDDLAGRVRRAAARHEHDLRPRAGGLVRSRGRRQAVRAVSSGAGGRLLRRIPRRPRPRRQRRARRPRRRSARTRRPARGRRRLRARRRRRRGRHRRARRTARGGRSPGCASTGSPTSPSGSSSSPPTASARSSSRRPTSARRRPRTGEAAAARAATRRACGAAGMRPTPASSPTSTRA